MPGPLLDTRPVINSTVVSRLRHGLATNSSSSHSMVVLPADVETFDEPPEGQRHVYANGWLAASEHEKRHVLAGMLVAQASEVWGRGVLLPEQGLKFNQATENLREELTMQIPAQTREDFDSAPAWRTYSPAISDIVLPAWLEAEITTLCGLPAGTDLSRHWTDSDLVGGTFTLPRAQGDVGPDTVAWAAFMTVVLDPATVLVGPVPNSAHPLQSAHYKSTRPLRLALE